MAPNEELAALAAGIAAAADRAQALAKEAQLTDDSRSKISSAFLLLDGAALEMHKAVLFQLARDNPKAEVTCLSCGGGTGPEDAAIHGGRCATCDEQGAGITFPAVPSQDLIPEGMKLVLATFFVPQDHDVCDVAIHIDCSYDFNPDATVWDSPAIFDVDRLCYGAEAFQLSAKR